MSIITAVGIDRGGTSVRFLAFDSRGKQICRAVAPSPSIEKFPALIIKILDKWKAPGKLSLVIATKGAWTHSWKKSFLKKALAKRAAEIEVISDMEAAHTGALGGKPGVIIISGTGSAAFAIDPLGEMAKAGGKGPEKGDEGSGYWIASKYLGAKGKKPLFNPGKTGQTAAYAKTVIEKAREGDPAAAAVVNLAHIHLCTLILDLIKRLFLKPPVAISWGGSVMENDFFRDGVRKMLETFYGKEKFRLTAPLMSPVEAAARLALVKATEAKQARQATEAKKERTGGIQGRCKGLGKRG